MFRLKIIVGKGSAVCCSVSVQNWNHEGLWCYLLLTCPNQGDQIPSLAIHNLNGEHMLEKVDKIIGREDADQHQNTSSDDDCFSFISVSFLLSPVFCPALASMYCSEGRTQRVELKRMKYSKLSIAYDSQIMKYMCMPVYIMVYTARFLTVPYLYINRAW